MTSGNSVDQEQKDDIAPVLRSTVTHNMVKELYRTGHFDEKARDHALTLLRPPGSWWSWADRLLLLIGTGLVLSGIIFFFAYNWEDMGGFLKFGLVGLGMVGCVTGAHWKGLDSIVGKTLLLSASVLTGVLFAIFGQVYQTGADAYELFIAWAVLILGWVIAARFGPLWITWLTITNTALILYWQQVLNYTHWIEYPYLFIALALVNGVFLAVRELSLIRGRGFAQNRWVRDVVLIAVLTDLTIPVLQMICDESLHVIIGVVQLDASKIAYVISLVIWSACMAGVYFLYRYRLPDIRALAYGTLALSLFILALIGRLLFEAAPGPWTFLFFGFIVVGVMSLAVHLLRLLRNDIRGRIIEA